MFSTNPISKLFLSVREIKFVNLRNYSSYYSSNVFDSCIYSITTYFWSSIFWSRWSTSSSPSSFNSSCTVFHEEQLDFPVAHLENCKRISRWANWNSRWRHLDRNLWRWKTIKFNKHLLRWLKYCKWRWLPRMMQL